MQTGSSLPIIAADVPFAALAPLIVVAVGFVAYCPVDLARAPAVRHLPKWAWAVICVVSVPLEGIIYLIVGRGERD